MFVMDNGIKVLQTEYVKGIKASSFEALTELIKHYQDMGGKLYGCNPSVAARDIKTESCLGGINGFVNASKLIESSVAANAVFTY
jgi:predicted peroxiredoxin